MSAAWSRFCVVGLGKHAQTKIIPAISRNGQELAGVVTSKSRPPHLGAPAFAHLEAALTALPDDTAFIIASPPTAHFDQARTVLSSGRDVIVEKPPFITRREAESALQIASQTGALLVEGFMNRYTRTHRHFIAACRNETPVAIRCAFTIPKAPAGTFRSNSAIGSSNLYDVGSYFLAALLDLELPLDTLNLVLVENAGTPDREKLTLHGMLQGIQVEATIGVDRAYANRLELRWADGRSTAYEPFFFGREADRTVVHAGPFGTCGEIIHDVDAFAAMFAIAPAIWREDARERAHRTLALATGLERLGEDLAAFRRH